MKQNDGTMDISTKLEKDQGVNLDPYLKFSQHTEIQVNTANKILGIRRSYEYLDADNVKKRLVALVRPYLDLAM